MGHLISLKHECSTSRPIFPGQRRPSEWLFLPLSWSAGLQRLQSLPAPTGGHGEQGCPSDSSPALSSLGKLSGICSAACSVGHPGYPSSCRQDMGSQQHQAVWMVPGDWESRGRMGAHQAPAKGNKQLLVGVALSTATERYPALGWGGGLLGHPRGQPGLYTQAEARPGRSWLVLFKKPDNQTKGTTFKRRENW